MALADVLKGPAYFVDSLPSKLGEVRKARSGFADSTTFTSPLDLPEPGDHAERDWAPQSARDVTKQGMKAVFAALRSRVDGSKDEAPQVAVPARFSIWPSFIGVRSAWSLQPMGIRWHGSVAIASSTAATCACASALHANLLVTGNACHANTTNTASLPWTRGAHLQRSRVAGTITR